MKLVTPKQMSRIDRTAIKKFGIPGIVLMENAALAVVSEVMNVIGDTGTKKAIVVCGKGNNGGDGFAVARHLHLKGIDLEIYLVGARDEVAGDALINLKITEKLGISVVEICGDAGIEAFKQSFRNSLESNCVIVDALFGTGFKGEVSGPACDVINIINSACCRVISVDIPSGVNGETGEVGSVCVEADRTVTFGFPKVGLAVAPGCEMAGKLRVADIGIPQGAVDGNEINTFLLDREELKGIVCKRKIQSNKGDYGRVLIITGSTGMTGAGSLAASSALRAGAGLVYIAAPQSLTKIYACNVAEAIQLPLEDEGRGSLSAKCIRQLEKMLEGKTAVAIGPGLSTAGDVPAVVRFVLENANIPLIIDADALNSIAAETSISTGTSISPDSSMSLGISISSSTLVSHAISISPVTSVLGKIKNKAIVTPHPGEMARLTGKSIEYIQKHRLETAREFSAKWNVITVLKGSRTVIALPDGRAYINTTGNPGMATAGTGDVLTGIITALAARGINPEKAALLGVYLHGRAGDLATGELGENGLVASDLVKKLPEAYEEFIAE